MAPPAVEPAEVAISGEELGTSKASAAPASPPAKAGKGGSTPAGPPEAGQPAKASAAPAAGQPAKASAAPASPPEAKASSASSGEGGSAPAAGQPTKAKAKAKAKEKTEAEEEEEGKQAEEKDKDGGGGEKQKKGNTKDLKNKTVEGGEEAVKENGKENGSFDVDKAIKKFAKDRQRYLHIVTQAGSMNLLIESDNEWLWAKDGTMHKKLAENVKKLTDTVAQGRLESLINKQIKALKSESVPRLQTMLSKFSNLGGQVGDLESIYEKLVKMHEIHTQ